MKILKWTLIIVLVCTVGYTGYQALALTWAIENQIVTVTTVATKLPPTPLVGRKYLLLKNLGSEIVYIGKSDVTADTAAATGGFQLLPQEKWYGQYDHSVDVYGIVASDNCNVAVEEGK